MMTYRLRQILLLTYCSLSIFFVGCKESNTNNFKVQDDNLVVDETPKWTYELIEGYRTLNEGSTIEAADQVYRATELMPKKNWENYLVCATIYAPNGENEKAFVSLEKAIEAGFMDAELLGSLSELSKLHIDKRWDALVSKIEHKREVYQNALKSPQLLEILKELWAHDQRELSNYEANIKSLDSNATTKDYQHLFEGVENRWEINKNKLDSIIKIHGWPGYKLVGEEGAKIAWAIAQHYPDVFFKNKCLSLLKQAVEKEDANPNHYAELNDRIARETWQKQLYGASMGEDAPYPIKDPAHVNKRRIELGLFEPVEVYALYHGIEYELPSQEEIQSSFDKAQTQYAIFENFISEKQVDSANTYITLAVANHGDISNEQLYAAAIKLVKMKNNRSTQICLKILKVLIWRKWEKRNEILNEISFDALHDNLEWKTIQELIKKSE